MVIEHIISDTWLGDSNVTFFKIWLIQVFLASASRAGLGRELGKEAGIDLLSFVVDMAGFICG